MKIIFLLHNAYGIGGTIRATVNLATALAERHEVEIVSSYRPADRMRLPAGPGVRVRALVDLRPGARRYAGDDPGQSEPGVCCPHDVPYRGKLPPSRLLEDRLADFLRRTDADVVVATRPYLVCFLARHGGGSYLRVGQEHLTHGFHREEVRRDQDAAVADLDAFVTVSEGDARTYRAALPAARTRLTHIPNCCPAPEAEPSTGDSRTVVAAGRLMPVKRYERLVGAFAKVARQHPDWTLRIYGRGRREAALRRRIDELGLHDHVFLMGARTPIDAEWAKAAVAAVSSSTEAFGMTLVEAMRLGVPVVSTDCDHGPREILTHGEDGLLVPQGPQVEDGLADALCRLIENDAERRRMGEAARRNARRFLPGHVARQYEALFVDLGAPRDSRGPRTVRTPVGARERLGRWAERLGVARLLGKALPPLAVDCRAAADGTLAFRVPTTGLGRGRWELVLCPGKGTDGDELRLPFRTPAEGAVALMAVPPQPLPEGRWTVRLREGGRGGRTRTVSAGLVETAALLRPGARPRPGAAGGPDGPDGAAGPGWAAAVPYATDAGLLAVRTWNRPEHAELWTFTVEEDELVLTGSLHGAGAVGRDHRMTARLRGGGAEPVRARCRVDEAGMFLARLPAAELAARHPGGEAVWNVQLTPSGEEGRTVRPARLFGDVADRKRTDSFRQLVLPAAEGEVRVRPYLTVRNNLALEVTGPAAGPAAGRTARPAVVTEDDGEQGHAVR